MNQSNSNNSNLQLLSDQYNNILTQYQNTYQDYISDLNNSSSESSKNGNNNQNNGNNKNTSKYSSQLESLNQQLLDINQQILDEINNSSSSYNTESQQRGQQNEILNQNNSTLINDKALIQKMMKEADTIDAANKNTELILTQQYSRYIVLMFVTLLLVILLFKFAVTGDPQRGGGGKNFVNEAMFLFIIMIVFLGLAHVFDNINGYVLLTILIIPCIVTKLKIVNNTK